MAFTHNDSLGFLVGMDLARTRVIDGQFSSLIASPSFTHHPADSFREPGFGGSRREPAAVSAADAAASTSINGAKQSRSSSMVSTVPAKARAMLGLEPPVRSPVPFPPPVRSWFRASSPGVDLEIKSRLENVELLLETSIRKILVEIQGKPLAKGEEVLVRALGQIVKLGEKGKGDARTTMM
ncbi:MAG: hypothetical protein Q9220_005143 [cf. Caloplaca sp. 1 TL-2023]